MVVSLVDGLIETIIFSRIYHGTGSEASDGILPGEPMAPAGLTEFARPCAACFCQGNLDSLVPTAVELSSLS